MSGLPPILVTRRLPDETLRYLRERCAVDLWDSADPMPRAELLARASGKQGLVTLLTDRVDAEVLERAGPSLRVVANYAVGVDNVDLAACTARGVLVTNTPDVLTDATADMAWALLLAAARNVAAGDRLVRSGRLWSWEPRMMLGQEVHHRVLGVVGFGRIGRAVARRARGFDMRVLYTARHRLPVEQEEGAAFRDLPSLLAESDFVSLHVPLTPQTHHLLGERELRLMKATAVLVNTARGPVVDEEALARALERGQIAGAGLDVFEREPRVHPALLPLENVVLAPHLGSATLETREAMGRVAADGVLAALSGARPATLVNADAWPTSG